MSKTKQVKADKKEVKKEIKPEIKAALDPAHLLQIETTTRDIENAKLLMAVEEQALKNLLLEEALLKINIEKKKAKLKEVANRYSDLNAAFTKFKKEVFPEYGIKENEGLGYNPLTGEIQK